MKNWRDFLRRCLMRLNAFDLMQAGVITDDEYREMLRKSFSLAAPASVSGDLFRECILAGEDPMELFEVTNHE